MEEGIIERGRSGVSWANKGIKRSLPSRITASLAGRTRPTVSMRMQVHFVDAHF